MFIFYLFYIILIGHYQTLVFVISLYCVTICTSFLLFYLALLLFSYSTPLIPSFHSNDVINQEIKKCSDETLVKNDDGDDEHDEYNCPLISQSLLSSSPSQSNTSSLAKQKLLGTCKKSVQLLAPPHHSKSLSGFSRESSMLLNGYTVNSVGSLSPISGDINSIICKWLIKLVSGLITSL